MTVADHWRLPTGTDAQRVHQWVERLLSADAQGWMDVAGARELLARCELAAWGSASECNGVLDVWQLLWAVADLLADAPADALPPLEQVLAPAGIRN